MEIARDWRLQRERYRLIGEVCDHCDAKIFPPRDVCPNCKAEAKNEFQFSGKGEIVSLAKIYDAPEGFEGLAPYYVALVKLAEGPTVTAQLTDVGEVLPEIGWPVEMSVRMLNKPLLADKGLIKYGFKFRLSMDYELSTQREKGN